MRPKAPTDSSETVLVLTSRIEWYVLEEYFDSKQCASDGLDIEKLRARGSQAIRQYRADVERCHDDEFVAEPEIPIVVDDLPIVTKAIWRIINCRNRIKIYDYRLSGHAGAAHRIRFALEDRDKLLQGVVEPNAHNI